MWKPEIRLSSCLPHSQTPSLLWEAAYLSSQPGGGLAPLSQQGQWAP